MKYLLYLVIGFTFLSEANAQCLQDRHNTSAKSGWTSCIKTQNPNPERGISHWIMYDLGQLYEVQQSHFWNVNEPLNTNQGLREILVDLSYDGVNWKEWGTFMLSESDGSSFYEGETGPDFSGFNARYVLFTPLSNHGGSCYGLAEVKIGVGESIISSTEELTADLEMNLSPNPAVDFSMLNLNYEGNGKAVISIVESSGRVVNQFTHAMSNGTNQIQISTKEYIPGIYNVNVSIEGNVFNQELIIMK